MHTTQKLIIGDCRESLKNIPNDSIDCVVTSPPYWGLRDYKTDPVIWGGSDDCVHEWNDSTKIKSVGCGKTAIVGNQLNGASDVIINQSICSKCNAWKGQLGLEPDPNLYIKHLCDIFDQVKRVLKPSGTCWVNLGDSYSTGGGSTNKDFNERYSGGASGQRKQENEKPKMNIDMPDKCLVQIPSRFALEMTSRGWILRNEIIWHKPNCMPSSVTDRFTVDFEKVFFFVKSKRYYFKQQYEKFECNDLNSPSYRKNGKSDSRTKHVGIEGVTPVFSDNGFWKPEGAGRNKRTVWTIPTRPYSGSHFAVFPIDLIAPMIDAGCPPNGTVMDIFSGSGTVLEYCRDHDLNGIGLELNPEYEKLAADRAMLNVPNILQYAEDGTTENDIQSDGE